jgi:hypothetical protein
VTIPIKQKLIVVNAINLIVEINQAIVDNARKGTQAELRLPSLIDRAFMVHHESGVIPVADYLAEE